MSIHSRPSTFKVDQASMINGGLYVSAGTWDFQSVALSVSQRGVQDVKLPSLKSSGREVEAASEKLLRRVVQSYKTKMIKYEPGYIAGLSFTNSAARLKVALRKRQLVKEVQQQFYQTGLSSNQAWKKAKAIPLLQGKGIVDLDITFPKGTYEAADRRFDAALKPVASSAQFTLLASRL